MSLYIKVSTQTWQTHKNNWLIMNLKNLLLATKNLFMTNTSTQSEAPHLLWTVNLWPELEESNDNRFCEGRVLLEKLHHTVRQLRVVHTQRFHFVERKQHLQQEHLVLFLQGQREPIDNTAQHKIHGHYTQSNWCNVIEYKNYHTEQIRPFHTRTFTKNSKHPIEWKYKVLWNIQHLNFAIIIQIFTPMSSYLKGYRQLNFRFSKTTRLANQEIMPNLDRGCTSIRYIALFTRPGQSLTFTIVSSWMKKDINGDWWNNWWKHKTLGIGLE